MVRTQSVHHASPVPWQNHTARLAVFCRYAVSDWLVQFKWDSPFLMDSIVLWLVIDTDARVSLSIASGLPLTATVTNTRVWLCQSWCETWCHKLLGWMSHLLQCGELCLDYFNLSSSTLKLNVLFCYTQDDRKACHSRQVKIAIDSPSPCALALNS